MNRNDLTDDQIEAMAWDTQDMEQIVNSAVYHGYTFGSLTISHITTGFEYPISGDHIARERARA